MPRGDRSKAFGHLVFSDFSVVSFLQPHPELSAVTEEAGEEQRGFGSYRTIAVDD